MKIHPPCHGVSFHPSFLSVSIKRCEKITKEGVDRDVAHSTLLHHKTATCTCDIISNAPAVFILRVLYYIVNFRILANIYKLDK